MIIESGDSIIVKIKVQPRASKNEIVGIRGDALKIRLTSPPVDGRANVDCIGFLSDVLGIKKGDIAITFGKKGRDKKIRINGLSAEKFLTLLKVRVDV